jgi:hypothetical protein
MANDYFSAGPEVDDFYKEALKYASFVTIEIGEEYRKTKGAPITNGALYSIATESIALHKVVHSLCCGGWAFATALILRTMLDLYANILVIVNAENNDSEFMAFRYTHYFLKANLNNPVLADESRVQIREEIKQLHEDLQSKAHDYMFKGKLLGYWYSPEYSNTKDILGRFDSSLKSDIYNKLSSASHGGLLGLRLFKDAPDKKSPDPRADKKSQNLALSVSNRLMLEIFGRYSCFMDKSTDALYIKLIRKFQSLKSIIKEQQDA